MSACAVCSVSKSPHLFTTVILRLTEGPERKGNRLIYYNFPRSASCLIPLKQELRNQGRFRDLELIGPSFYRSYQVPSSDLLIILSSLVQRVYRCG